MLKQRAGAPAQARGSTSMKITAARPGAEEALNAPLFQSLIERLRGGGRSVVLDLGAARTETLKVFGQFRCRFDIVELADNVEALNAEDDPHRLRQRAEASLPRKGADAVDVILCWDLINYLTRPALTAVMECIALRCKRGAFAHGLVYYSAARMPERPGCFVPVDDSRLMNVAKSTADRPAPRYTPEDLATCMPRFTVERGRLLRNGMQEFLLRL